MLRTDLLVGRYRTVEVLHRYGCGELVRAEADGAPPVLLLLPATETVGRAERRRLETLSGAGTPRCVRWLGGPGTVGALVLDVPADARPLFAAADLPPVTLRSGLVRLLRALSRAHSRGLVHAALSRAAILADPCGEFWIADWSAARPSAGSDADVAADLEALGRAFVAALRRADWPDDARPSASDDDVEELRFPGLSRDFARVLSRMVAGDPRTSYRSATEVLADLGYPDTADPWVFAPFVGRSDHVDRVERWLVEACEPPDGEPRTAPTVVEVVGAHGSGRSRLLGEIATRLRAAGAVVFRAQARSGATWGGIGEIARQVAQFVPDGPLHTEHAEVLSVLAGEVATGPADGAAAATAALCDFVRTAFSESPGALLLDDADELRPAERDTWRALGRYLAAVNDDGAGIQVVLVSTAVQPTESEPDTRREVIRVGEWPAERLREFLERVLANPAAARDVAGPLLAAAGGCPGEVVEYLRDLERNGRLVAEGARWRFEAPLHELGAWTPGIAEYVRRATASIGPDARALVETLSVAIECRLTRTDVSALSELSGPRLWQAAERSVEAGLLRAAGSTWRTRTEGIRRKVYAGIADGRRRSLHRELLQRLLDRDPPDLLGAAHHSCACGEAHAGDRTERALEQLAATHSYDAAIRLLEHAATTLGEPDWGRTRHLQLANLRRRAGRLGEAIEQLDTLLSDPATPPDTAAQARLSLVEAHYYARQWEDAIAVPLPAPPADPDLLAQMRLLRAACHAYMHRAFDAAREHRLARAELGGNAASVRVAIRTCDVEYLLAFARSEFENAANQVLRCLRLCVRGTGSEARVRALVRYANLQRFLGNGDLALAVIARARDILRQTPRDRYHLRHAYSTTRGYVLDFMGEWLGAIAEWERAYHAALQTGVTTLGRALRMRLVYARLIRGVGTLRDRAAARAFLRGVGDLTRRDLLDAGIAASQVAVWYGYQAPLERMCENLRQADHRSLRVRQVLARGVFGRLLLAAPLDMQWLELDTSDGQRLVDHIVGLSGRLAAVTGALVHDHLLPDEDLALLLPAYLLRRGRFLSHDWPEHWTAERMLGWVSQRRGHHAAAALGMALVLWAPRAWTQMEWDSLLDAALACGDSLPIPLLWQRRVVESSDAWRRGARAEASRLLAAAQASLGTLRGRTGDKWAARAADLGEEFVRRIRSRRGSRVSALTRSSSVSRPSGVTPLGRSASPGLESWSESFAAVRASRRAVVYSPFPRELARFVEELGWDLLPRSPEPALLSNEQSVCLYLPSLMRPQDLRANAGRLSRSLSTATHAIVALCSEPASFRVRGPLSRWILELIDGTRVNLSGLCSDPDRRHALFEEALSGVRPGFVLDPGAAREVSRYPWPGGLAEVEAVAGALSEAPGDTLTAELLNAYGWELRVRGARSGNELANALESAIHELELASSSELSAAVQRPPRSVQRELARLVRLGRVSRLGRARATRYRLAARSE